MIEWYEQSQYPAPQQVGAIYLAWGGSPILVTWFPNGFWGNIFTGQPVGFNWWTPVQSPGQEPPWHHDPNGPPWWHMINLLGSDHDRWHDKLTGSDHNK